MIAGVVKSDEARIRLKLKGLRGREQGVEAVIDTGYTASLTLPPALVAALGLRWRSVDRFTLADGSECIFDVYVAKVDWDGKVRTIPVVEADGDSLVGMRLLRGHDLRMQVRPAAGSPSDGCRRGKTVAGNRRPMTRCSAAFRFPTGSTGRRSCLAQSPGAAPAAVPFP